MVLMFATIGVAVALSRTPAARVQRPRGPGLRPARLPPPAAAHLGNIFSLWWLDLFFAVVAAVLAGLYGAGLLRLRRRGDRWSWGRTASWYIGVALRLLHAERPGQ
ncbi:hypothetical protein GCM10020220_045510 [Nonomuraea rubra]